MLNTERVSLSKSDALYARPSTQITPRRGFAARKHTPTTSAFKQQHLFTQTAGQSLGQQKHFNKQPKSMVTILMPHFYLYGLY